MTSFRTLMLAMAAAAVLCGCVASPPSPTANISTDPAKIEAGRTMVERLCTGCHAVGIAGESPNPEAPPLRKLAERYPLTHLEEAFAEGVLVGHPAMPEFKLSEAEIDNILAYLQTIQERRGA
jgi:mono/diheme cytochrome c family protein